MSISIVQVPWCLQKCSIALMQIKVVNCNNAYTCCHWQFYKYYSYCSFDAILRFLFHSWLKQRESFVKWILTRARCTIRATYNNLVHVLLLVLTIISQPKIDSYHFFLCKVWYFARSGTCCLDCWITFINIRFNS